MYDKEAVVIILCIQSFFFFFLLTIYGVEIELQISEIGSPSLCQLSYTHVGLCIQFLKFEPFDFPIWSLIDRKGKYFMLFQVVFGMISWSSRGLY